MNLKGITINGIHSFHDIGLTLSGRVLNPPKPMTVRKTVPYKSGSYDFSMISGERIYSDAIIEYEFSFADFDLQEIEKKKDEAIGWLCLANERAEISDDALFGKHYNGILTDVEWDEDFGEATLSVRFTCSPFKEADVEKEYSTNQGILKIKNAGNVFAYAKISGDDLKIDGNPINGKVFKLPPGRHKIEASKSASITYRERWI